MKCSLCFSRDLSEVLDFGDVALAGAFLSVEQVADEELLPLKLVLCNHCHALQVEHKVDAKVLFSNYFYFSSAIPAVREHAKRCAERISDYKPRTVVEIGCNDGVLLRQLIERVPMVVGVDPAANVAWKPGPFKGLEVVTDFFTQRVAKAIDSEHGRADVIVANNVLAHIPDLHETMRAIDRLLSCNGVLVCEVHSLSEMIKATQYDWIYHEHLYYWSMRSIERFFRSYSFEIFDVEDVPMHGGSRRYHVGRIGQHPVRASVRRTRELDAWLDGRAAYAQFAINVEAHRDRLRAVVEGLRGRVVAYGASGRANTLLQVCELGHESIDYIVDDAPAKHGFYTPGTHIPIYSPEVLKTVGADNVLVLAWNYLDDIAQKCGDARLVVPFPSVKTIERVPA